jgi:enoyl-CoA hydratase/carnithine racemase
MSDSYVRVDHDGEVVTITLDRAAQRNALSLPMMKALTRALLDAGTTDARGVILAADGPAFSAGHHFGDMLGADVDAAEHLFRVCTAMMDAVQSIPQVVIARVHALATAAGCQLVATCDLAVAAASAGFALPGGKGGLFCHTPAVAVARNIGRKRAIEMAFTGDVIDAATAADWGLVNRVVPDAELVDATAELMRRATRGSAASKALGKRELYAQMGLPQAAAYEHAIAAMAAAATTPDAQEGFAAFLEKREPEFTQPANAATHAAAPA